MSDYLLVINAGSSSIKFTVYLTNTNAQLSVDATGQFEGIGTQPKFTATRPDGAVLAENVLPVNAAHNHAQAMTVLISWLLLYLEGVTLIAVGHRVVHGGLHYAEPVLIDAKVLSDLEALIPLAPLHQQYSLIAIRALAEAMPDLPQVACFDTAFHQTQPEVAQRLALPRHYFDEGIRRYGFHGLSFEYIFSQLSKLDPLLANARIIVAHLGNGASLCALSNGRSVATTMGFSPLDGLVMGTRCGSIDPGVLLYLMDKYRMDVRALEQLLYYESGLKGVSGISGDMRLLLASDDPRAQDAVGLFVYRIGRELGSLAAALGGIDALIFTGGIGEHSTEIRSRICLQAAWLGLELDPIANEAAANRISKSNCKVSSWIVATDENVVIANHTLRRVCS